jgi:hypothetical protein
VFDAKGAPAAATDSPILPWEQQGPGPNSLDSDHNGAIEGLKPPPKDSVVVKRVRKRLIDGQMTLVTATRDRSKSL